MDTRYHWIKEFLDDKIVKVKYVKSENNVADILTKNLQPKLFEKHASELISDVGFFIRCDKTKFTPKKKIPRWRLKENREVRWRMLPGFIQEWSTFIPFVGPDLNRKRYRKIEWWGNDERIDYHLKKAHYDCIGKRIIPDSYKKVCIKKVYDPDGNIVKIYDTDRRVVIGRVEDDYSKGEDMENMLELVNKT